MGGRARSRGQRPLGLGSSKPRPGFAALLADVEAGRVAAVIAWDQDRLARTPEEWARFRRACRRHGTRVAFYTDGEVAIGTISGGIAAGVRAVLSDAESEVKSERVKAAVRERAATGKAHGRLLYGWRRVIETDARGQKSGWHDEVDPAQAAVVVEIAEALLAGRSLSRVTATLNNRGEPTATGNGLWSKVTLRKLMQRPANVGRRVHHGKVVGPAQAPAILDEATYDRVCALLADPSRRTITDNRVRHLLSGIAECGICGAKVRAREGTGVRRYQCSGRGCVSRPANDIDAAVIDTLAAYLDVAAVVNLDQDDADAAAARADVDALRDRLDVAADEYAELVADAASYRRIRDRIEPKLQAAKERTRASGARPGVGLAAHLADADDIARAWDALTIEQQRAVVSETLRVRILHASGRTFRRDDLDISPRV